jgi:hypothetical protein
MCRLCLSCFCRPRSQFFRVGRTQRGNGSLESGTANRDDHRGQCHFSHLPVVLVLRYRVFDYDTHLQESPRKPRSACQCPSLLTNR